jgi:hypothetical protein
LAFSIFEKDRQSNKARQYPLFYTSSFSTVAPTRLLDRLFHGSKAKQKKTKTTVVSTNCPSNGVTNTKTAANNVDQILSLDDINSPTAFVATITAKQRVQPSTSHESSPVQNGDVPVENNPYRTFQKEPQHYFQEPPNWNPNRFKHSITPPSTALNSGPTSASDHPKKKPMLQSDVAL